MNPRGGGDLSLGLVIPTVGEAANLPGLLADVGRVLDSSGLRYEVIVVDDDSRDGTEAVVAEAVRANPRIRLLVRHVERGLAGAIQYGWRSSAAQVLGVMDGDGQHPPKVLPALIAAVQGGADLAIASRYTAGSRQAGWHPLRRAISWLAICATRPLRQEGLRVRDPLSGFFLIRSQCVQPIMFQPAGFKLLVEILARGRVRSVSEVPFTFGVRRAGRSKVSAGVVWAYLTLLTRLYRERIAMAGRADEASGD